jgi:hypothetical protein
MVVGTSLCVVLPDIEELPGERGTDVDRVRPGVRQRDGSATAMNQILPAAPESIVTQLVTRSIREGGAPKGCTPSDLLRRPSGRQDSNLRPLDPQICGNAVTCDDSDFRNVFERSRRRWALTSLVSWSTNGPQSAPPGRSHRPRVSQVTRGALHRLGDQLG